MSTNYRPVPIIFPPCCVPGTNVLYLTKETRGGSNDKIQQRGHKVSCGRAPYAVRYCKSVGDFQGEIHAIDKLLACDIPYALRMRLTIEREVAKGLKKDYKTDFDRLLAKIREKYPACSAQELCEIVRRGHTDYILKGDLFRIYFQNSAAANILRCHEKDLRQLSDPYAEPPVSNDRAENYRIMKEKGYRAFRFEVRMSLSPTEAAERVGEKIRVHLPYPAACESQPAGDIRLLSSPTGFHIGRGAENGLYREYSPKGRGLQREL